MIFSIMSLSRMKCAPLHLSLENCSTPLYLAVPDLDHLLFSPIQMYLYSWTEFRTHIGIRQRLHSFSTMVFFFEDGQRFACKWPFYDFT